MTHQPDKFITTAGPPEASIGLGRLSTFLRGAVVGAVAALAIVPACPTATVDHAEVEETLREIEALKRAESEIRLRLLREGVIVPRNQEAFR